MKKSIKSILSVIMASSLALTACGGNQSTGGSQPSADQSANVSGSSQEKMVIKLGHQISNTSALHKGAEKFKELVEAKSNGAMEVQIFPSGQLGNARAQAESNIMGTIHISMGSTPLLATFAPKATALALPYIIKGENERERYASMKKLAKSDAFAEITQQATEKGLKIIPEAIWWYGDRHVTSKKPINTPEDLKGLKIRTPDDARVHIVPFEKMGANVTAMAFGEVYMGLSTGIIDAQENPINAIYTSKFYEVQDYINLTGHMTQAQFGFISQKWWDSLSKEQQTIIQDAMIEAGDYSSELTLTSNEADIAELEKNGMEVVEVD